MEQRAPPTPVDQVEFLGVKADVPNPRQKDKGLTLTGWQAAVEKTLVVEVHSAMTGASVGTAVITNLS